MWASVPKTASILALGRESVGQTEIEEAGP